MPLQQETTAVHGKTEKDGTRDETGDFLEEERNGLAECPVLEWDDTEHDLGGRCDLKSGYERPDG
jgi:hypothetical protein